MRILIAVVLILAVCCLLLSLFYNTKTYIKNKPHDKLDLFSYTTFLIIVGIVVMGYLFVLYAKAF